MNSVAVDGIQIAPHSPAHADPHEEMQALSESVSHTTGSFALRFAESGLALGKGLSQLMQEYPVPDHIKARLSKVMMPLKAQPIVYGPTEGSEAFVLHIAINAERHPGSELRPIGTSDADDLLKITTLTQDVPFEDGHTGSAERIVYLLFTHDEYERYIPSLALASTPALRVPSIGLNEDLEPPKLFLTLLKEAVDHGASDIHIEPYDAAYRIRFRIDGALKIHPVALSVKEAASLISHIKVRANLDISEKRMEQAGVISFDGSKEVDEAHLKGVSARVSTMPTVAIGTETQTETCVLRVGRRTTSDRFRLDKLGYTSQQLDMLHRNLEAPDGLILLTGPTGSGKTTTLYSCLTALISPEMKIVTAEHPVEVLLPGTVQTPADPEHGRTFGYLLRGFLRQDPDIIMIGEIRDKETADAAVSAVTTGHQVFSTMHVTRASEVVTRLTELGVAPSQMIASLRLCIAQRLVRVFDPRLLCSLEDYDAASELNQLAGKEVVTVPFMAKRVTMRGRPVHDVMNGRRCVSEMWELGDASKSAILSGVTDAIALQKVAIEHDGLEPMFVAGLRMLRQGKTSLEELRRTVLSGRDLRDHPELVVSIAKE